MGYTDLLQRQDREGKERLRLKSIAAQDAEAEMKEYLRLEKIEYTKRLRLEEIAEKESVRVEQLQCTPPNNGRSYFLELPKEISNRTLKYTVGDYREPGAGPNRFSIQADSPFQAPVMQLTKATREQAETHTIVLRSVRAMFYFKAFLEKYDIFDHGRGLEFPRFHLLNSGRRFTGGRHGPPGIYGDVELTTMCPNLMKVEITLHVATRNGERVRCHTVDDFKRRYSLQQVYECPMLKHVVLLMNNWNDGAENMKSRRTQRGNFRSGDR